MAKVSKQQADYTDKPVGPKRCVICSMYLPFSRSCTLVEGSINPLGRCKYWQLTAFSGKPKEA